MSKERPAVSEQPAGHAWLRSGEPSLRRVNQGVTLLYVSVVLLLLTAIVSSAFGIYAYFMDSWGILPGLGWVATAVVTLAWLLFLVGQVLCIWVPSASGSRGWIILAVICLVTSVLLEIAGIVSVSPHLQDDLVKWLKSPEGDMVVFISIGANVLGVWAFAFLILFIRGLAAFIRRGDIAARAALVLTGYLLIIAIAACLGVFAWISSIRLGPGLLLVLMVPCTLLILAVIVLFMRLVESLRNALRQPYFDV